MVFDLDLEMVELDGVVYENKDGEWVAICIPTRASKLWYETWLEMKKRIDNSDFRFKNY